ncbi:N-acetyl-gamma-glutamyl-phosphate reductase [Limihaloglobus sulfuriphilus]|uniref:N-acetyl-gamma-glutamyl-phosphate reductase n=1 Tax=Limihaloglobus sulfuriphilus TaxID=1851148 RepID=A0A1Q2MFZ0_9BACT|nr:N-acetyl-gamma-glutamyl-phosphate reductase [Limihaloglobus sulfuriphilus]AQQ71468.1 N-acetyl-gamma-glutamyl-phosphate reductase [Limihaloglobus sulfuriphilus]
MINVAIIGVTGYTGLDSIEILLRHPQAEITYITSSTKEVLPIESVHPKLAGRLKLDVEPLDFDELASRADVALCCLPHKVSMSYVPEILKRGVKVVDFSADYRLKDLSIYEKYYVPHTDPENIKQAVYGLPELYREQIKTASLVANPGCFPTSSTLGLVPLLRNGYVETDTVIVNSVSGATGAGKKLADGVHFPNLNENIRPYGIATHRHGPEMEQIASEAAGKEVSVLFQPHIGSFDRGILSSIYCRPAKEISAQELLELFNGFYADEPFVQVFDSPVSVKDVANTNQCHIHPARVKGQIVVFAAIDNLVKGASGQAVQNMNIMSGFDETLGLK